LASTTDYCTSEAVIARLSQGGLLACADDDADGTINSTETANSITPAIAFATAQIEAALKSAGINVPVTQDSSDFDVLLENIAIDIVVHRLSTRRGHSPTPAVETAYADARKDLGDIAARRRRVPSFTYPGDGMIERRAAIGRPTVANPMRRR
jgi:hypothetical protein